MPEAELHLGPYWTGATPDLGALLVPEGPTLTDRVRDAFGRAGFVRRHGWYGRADAAERWAAYADAAEGLAALGLARAEPDA